MVKMAAGEEKQQTHRPGVFKQKNKGHKHGKHRTKGEIERENKGETFLLFFITVITLSSSITKWIVQILVRNNSLASTRDTPC